MVTRASDCFPLRCKHPDSGCIRLTVGVRLAALTEIHSAILRYYHKGHSDTRRPPPSRPGAVRVVSPPVADEDVIVGEELPPEERKAALKEDLAFLFGTPVEPEAVEKLEKKFWALMRVLSRKGLVTKEEFAQELDESDG